MWPPFLKTQRGIGYILLTVFFWWLSFCPCRRFHFDGLTHSLAVAVMTRIKYICNLCIVIIFEDVEASSDFIVAGIVFENNVDDSISISNFLIGMNRH